MRAERIGIGNDECYIYSETNLENILRQSRIIDTHAVDGAVVGISECPVPIGCTHIAHIGGIHCGHEPVVVLP